MLGVRPAAARTLGVDGPCHLCDGDDWSYLFRSGAVLVYRCADCGLTRGHPQGPPEDRVIDGGTLGRADPGMEYLPVPDSLPEREAAKGYLRLLRGQGQIGSLLTVAPTGHPFADVAHADGCRVETWLNVAELGRATLPEHHYDSVIVVFQLEKSTEPLAMLEKLRRALTQNGSLLVVTPSLESWPARLFRDQWTEWRPENLYYFDPQTIQGALLRAGFGEVRVRPDERLYSLQHLHDRARAFPHTALTRSIRLLSHGVPGPLRRDVRMKLTGSSMVITARPREPRPRPLLSIVMPVYNERESFALTMDAVLEKAVPGVDKEIIVVESSSRDGTRELVQQYRNHPDVTVLLQERAKGKGNAVREGFKLAQGDFVLIQDADQEYDVEDYDALIRPLQTYQRAFVLGSRHIGGWKIREFNATPGVVQLFNFGHLLFLSMFNVLYGQRLRDPFTMYKVFWRDCLHGLHLECNRFDFDFELVIKLIRKGYRPLEIPVNYRSRSFQEGKKVSVLRDPLTWLRALLRYRFGSIYRADPA